MVPFEKFKIVSFASSRMKNTVVYLNLSQSTYNFLLNKCNQVRN